MNTIDKHSMVTYLSTLIDQLEFRLDLVQTRPEKMLIEDQMKTLTRTVGDITAGGFDVEPDTVLEGSSEEGSDQSEYIQELLMRIEVLETTARERAILLKNSFKIIREKNEENSRLHEMLGEKV